MKLSKYKTQVKCLLIIPLTSGESGGETSKSLNLQENVITT